MDTERPAFTLRIAQHQDRRARWNVTYAAWRSAYQHIYTPDEIEEVFNGAAIQSGSWVSRRKKDLGHLVAEVDGHIIGHSGMALLDQPREGEVTALYVLPEFNGQGIGRALWDAAVTKLRDYGCEIFWVWTIERAPAAEFYRHIGGQVVERGWYQAGNRTDAALAFIFR
ncbi:MAG: GNAT family N-acetyltransferase [Anaerolineae bacterium]|nr:GNAT family N-acetyltransferase [Anaerolineae bacterium]